MLLLTGQLRLFFCVVILLPLTARALAPMDDADLAEVNGQDGVTISLSGDQTANRMQILSDVGTAQEAGIRFDNLTVSGSGVDGLDASVDLDAGNYAGNYGISIDASWTNSDLTVENIRHTATPANSYGSLYMEGTGNFTLRGGPLSSSSQTGFFELSSQGDIILRQGGAGSAELSYGDLDLEIRTTDALGNDGTATIGIDPSKGLFLEAPFLDFALNFNLLFKESPTDFDTTGRDALILFGWEGGVTDADIRIGGGGIGYGSAVGSSTYQEFNYDGSLLGTRSEGLNIFAEWNYNDSFAFILGQAAGTQTRARFFNWKRMGNATIDFRLPIILDAINAGQGPGGICFGGSLPTSGALTAAGCSAVGGSFENVAPDASGLAVIIRDGRLHAYNTQVEVLDPGTAVPSEIFNWSLVYTFGKLDSNIYLYPEGLGGNTGIRADVLLAIQSPGYWEDANSAVAATRAAAGADWATNTHFLIADTATASAIPINDGAGSSNEFGIGIVNADLLWEVDNFYLRIIDGDTDYPTLPGGLWLQSNQAATYQFRGLFGGGSLEDLSDPVKISLIDVNLATDGFLFALSGAPGGQSYIGFDGLLNFDGTAYISLAEPSSPSSDFRLGNVSGNLAWRNGRIFLESAATTSDAKPALTIQNDLLFGATAAIGGTTPFQGDPLIGDVSFSGKSLGQVAIPSGQWYSSISLKKQ